MPRLPGGPATNLPQCPRAGHEAHRVVKDGHYGTPPRQRFRCVGDDGFHRFVPELPRHQTRDGTCDACDSHVPTHRGPVTGRNYDFPVRDVAAAFVAVGAGASYQRAALRARAASGRRLLEGEWGGNTVAEWLDALAPVVLDAYAETSWPETLVLDSTRFMAKKAGNGPPQLAFNVLGAYGYPGRGQGRPRVWALAAYHHATATEWADFLRSLDTASAPQLVITDGAAEIANAVRRVWPPTPSPSFPVPFLSRCEHHLRANAVEVLSTDRVDHYGSRRMDALNDAFRSPLGWDRFVRTITPKQAATSAWVAINAPAIAVQVGTRHLLPDHHSTAALDTHLGTVRDYLDARSFVLRNQRRTTALLGLVRLHLNGLDNVAQYAALLRARLDAGHGAAPPQRTGYDAGTSARTPAHRRLPASLRR